MRIFVTGRPHLNWKGYVRRHPDLGTPVHISLEANPDDIKKYLIQEISCRDPTKSGRGGKGHERQLRLHPTNICIRINGANRKLGRRDAFGNPCLQCQLEKYHRHVCFVVRSAEGSESNCEDSVRACGD